MATPIMGTDAVDATNAALVRKAISSNAKLDIKKIYGRVRYTGAIWEVMSTTDSSQLVSGNLAWSVNKLLVTVSGYTVATEVQCTQATVIKPYHIQAKATSAGTIEVQFFDLTVAGAPLVIVQDTNMDINLEIMGA